MLTKGNGLDSHPLQSAEKQMLIPETARNTRQAVNSRPSGNFGAVQQQAAPPQPEAGRPSVLLRAGVGVWVWGVGGVGRSLSRNHLVKCSTS